MKFRKKPVVIEAMEYTRENRKAIIEWAGEALQSTAIGDSGEPYELESLRIKTLEGTMTVSLGDWVIRGVKGEVYPCKPDIFAATYAEDTGNDPVEVMRARKNAAYLERNRCVALIATMALINDWRAGIAKTAIEGWDEEWHGCVYIDLPNGQVSWHYHDSHAHLFAHLPAYEGAWDGHTTEQKYERVAEFAVY